jgi:YbbR domain-containing protein
MPAEPIQISPDSVTVYGEPFILDRLEKVVSEPLKFTDVSSDLQGEVRLEPIKGVRFSEDRIRYSLEVTRYVELAGTFPVTVTNVPEGKSMTIFPSRADVYLKCSFPYVGNPLEAVSLEVDYNDFQKSISGKCVVKLLDNSRDLIEYDIYPSVVECLVEDVM